MTKAWKFLGGALWLAFAIALLVWRWNHEMVRVYDFPPLRWPW